MKADRAARDQVSRELAELDRRVAQASRRLGQVVRERREAQQRHAELVVAYERKAEQLRDHQEALRAQIVAAYASGGDRFVKLLLNQEEPAEAQRQLTYFDYFNRARAERIEAARTALASLAELRRERDAERQRRERLEAQVSDDQAALVARRDARDARRDELEARIEERGRQAERLRAEVAEQEALLRDLRRRLADVPADAERYESFSAQRGRLRWPLEGEIAEHFGEPRSGGLKRTGITIAGEPGRAVQAVAAGRVVFSDWLRGLGLLVIIDHGDSYLTLYGHNEALYVELGEWIEGGTRIATVGSSGNRRDPGLYFEVRHGADPQNPNRWLR